MGITLGVIASTKLYFPALILLLVTTIHLLLSKQNLKTVLYTSAILLFLAFSIYTLSYLNYFAHGNSFRNFLGTQKWIFLFWKNNAVQVAKLYGAVIPFILFNQWKVWWGTRQYINFEHWSIFWPIIFILGIICSIYFLFNIKKGSFRGISTFLSIWVVAFILYLCFIPISPRYLMMLYFPSYILIALFLKVATRHSDPPIRRGRI